MTDRQNKRSLTPEEIELIASVWMRVAALKRLRRHGLPKGVEGAWIVDAVDFEIAKCIDVMDDLYEATEPEMDA